MKTQERLRLRRPKRKIHIVWRGNIPKFCINTGCGSDQFEPAGAMTYEGVPVFACRQCGRKYARVNR